MKLWDLSPRIDEELKVWPGDTPPTREVLCELEKGASVTLSTLRATVHLGSHVDGANHYAKGATGVEGWEIERFVGPCHVMEARAERGRRVSILDFGSTIADSQSDGGVQASGGANAAREARGEAALARIVHPRVLIKTGTYPDFRVFNEDFAGLEPSLIDALAGRGVKLIGVDTPSVDSFSSKDLPAHAACFRGGIAILEGLVMRDVEPGEYELIALPLKLAGFDASPVRAVLRRT
jgi:arylformamidase